MKSLFDETRIGTMRLRNRLVRSATWEAMADDTGRPTSRLVRVYEELALGGTGLIMTSATAFTHDATRVPGMLAIPDDSFVPAYFGLVQAVHAAGSPIVMQLVYPGRNGAFWTPADASVEDLRSIITGFGDAASRAQRAGFDGVQIHSAHGYFLSQFLSARRNARTDDHGGPVENRTRLLLEIMREIKTRTGGTFPVLVKINCSDFEEEDGVWDACQQACRLMAEQQVGAIEISGGIHHQAFPPKGLTHRESVFRDYAAEVARITDVPVILVGLNRTPSVITGLLNGTGIGYFSFSRPFLRQPGLAAFWRENPDEPARCLSCDACRKQPGGNVCPFRFRP